MVTERRFEIWPWVVTGMLTLSATVLCGFYWIAAAHPVALIDADPYAASLRFNHELTRLENGRALGWRLDVVTRAEPDAVRVELAASGALPADAKVGLRREHPSRGGYDAEFPLEQRPGGGWSARVPLPLPGRWRLIAWAADGDALVERVVELRRAP